MANKKPKNKQVKPGKSRDSAKRTRMLQVVLVVFSIILVLSMILSLTNY